MHQYITTMAPRLNAPDVKPGSPTIALVMPFDPKMTPRQAVEGSLKEMLGRVEKRLMAGHPADAVIPLIRRLQRMIRSLNYSSLCKSVAMFLSESVEKICYLDMAVTEKIAVDEPFRVRDLADCRRSEKEYLVLTLNAKNSKMYRGTGQSLNLIKSNAVYSWLNEVPESAGNKSDPDARKEVMFNKFLHHMDEGLSAVLKAYPFPVFVVGSQQVTEHFQSLTKNSGHIAQFVHYDDHDANEAILQKVLKPALENWANVRKGMIRKQLEQAANTGKLVCGIHAVRAAAACQNSRLLVLEKDTGKQKDPHGFFEEDAIDKIAGIVLSNGGEVEMADSDILEKYDHLALIRYY